MPNASELARIDREEAEGAAERVNNLRLPKADREAALRLVRNYEDAHGVELLPAYNGPQLEQDAALVKSDPAVITLQDLKDARGRVELLTPGEIGTIIIALGEAPGPQAKALINKLLGR